MLPVLFTAAIAMAPAAAVWDCISGPLMTTSEVSIQVFSEHNGDLVPFEGIEVVLEARGRATAAKTDAKGYMRFSGVAPGRYMLRMLGQFGLGPVFQPLRVVEPGSAPARMLAVGLLMVQGCSAYCPVVAPREGVTKAPACLAAKFFTARKRP